MLLFVDFLPAQILNAGFENWTNGTPDDWLTNDASGINPITRSTSSHSGSLAVKGTVISTSTLPIAPVLLSGADGNGFPISTRPAALHGFYLFAPTPGVISDSLVIGIAVSKQDTVIGTDTLLIGSATDSYQEFVANIQYTTSGTPDLINITVTIGRNGNGNLGTFYLLDDLSFGPPVGIPAAPTLLSPASGATNQSTTLTLTWNPSAGAASYRLQVSTDPNFSTTTYDASSLTATSTSISGLSYQTTYYWRVSATNVSGTSGWSNIWGFTTIAPPRIISFTPSSGPIGTTVTITGANFNTTAIANKVYFGAVKAAVNSATSTSLTVTVPLGTTYAPITVTDTSTGLTAYSSAPFVVTFPSLRVIDTTSFASKVDFATGDHAYCVAIGDIDGDGKPDLVVANNVSMTVSVLRNGSASGSITAGSFASKVDFATGEAPFGVAIGDVDGDGKPDLVVTNNVSATVSVFRNTSTPGSISFAAKTDFATAANPYDPYSVAIVDVDGDGKPDLVVTNGQSNTVSVFRNTSNSGSISFAAKVDFATGTNPFYLAIGDVDGDGKPDLIVSNYGSNTISVLRNTSTFGSVTFASKVDFTTGTLPFNVAIGDVDGDGKPDLVVANVQDNFFSVFRNTSTSGSITFASRIDLTTESGLDGIAMGDVDGDGKPDVVVPINNSNAISVFRNISSAGSIAFAAKVDFTTGTLPRSVAIGDIDGDGKPDLVVTNISDKTVSVLRNAVSPVAAPMLLSPANGATNQPTTLTLGWQQPAVSMFKARVLSKLRRPADGGVTYHVQLATDSNFVSGIVVDTSGVADTTLKVGGLLTATKYYWRVNAANVSGTSPWSSVWNFTTTSTYYGEYQPDANTVALYHLDETGGGTAFDVTGNNNGLISGTSVVTGRFGKARNFNGTSDNIRINFLPAYKVQNFTVEAWAMNTCANISACGGDMPCVLGMSDGGPSDGGGALNIASDLKFRFGVRGTTGGMVLISTSIAAVGQWIHVAGVRTSDGVNTSLKLYINGVLEASQTFQNDLAQFTNTTYIYFGDQGDNLGNGLRRWFGSIDEVRFSNIARSPQEFDLQLPPKNLTASAAGTTITLNWQNGGGAVPLMRYKIYRGADSTNVSFIDSTTSTSYANAGLSPATTHYYRVSAVDSTGFEGAKSYAASATTAAMTVPPTIVSFSPTSGPIGTTVTLTGTNFNTTAISNKVYFGAVKAAVSTASSTQLTVTVPLGATYVPITVTDTTTRLTACTSKPFTVTFPSSHIIDETSFAAKVAFTTGTYPWGVAIGDIDGDGKPDLVGANLSSNTVSVLRNTSTSGSITSSSFASKVDFTTGTSPEFVAIGDIDGDGKPDLVVSNDNSNTVSVFRNTSTPGSITFAPKVDFATGSRPTGNAIVDLDGDGKSELVVANQTSNTVSILRNISTSDSIMFASKVDFATGTSPFGVAVGDIDGDGKPDLVVTDADGSTVSVFRNASTSGSITASSFAAKVDFATGSRPERVSIGDIDGDGKPDLVVANRNSYTVSVLRNTSTSGSITFAAKVDFTTEMHPCVAIGDVDGDGKADLVVANGNSNTVSVFRNTSTPGSITSSSFASKVDFPAPLGAVVIGDIDGDGKPDLVMVDSASSALSVLRNTIAASNMPPTAPALVFPLSSASNQSTAPTLRWSPSVNAVSYRAQVATDSNFVNGIAANDSTVVDTLYNVNGLVHSTKYYWRVRAKNAFGISPWSVVWNFTTLYPSNFAVNPSVQFPTHPNASDYLVTDYRMVGIPGNPDTAVSHYLSGSHNVNWQVYWDNGAASNYLMEWDGSATFTFSTGKAFWLITKGRWSVSANVPSAQLDTSQQIDLPLHAGWNLITNPFIRSIPWSNVLAVNGLPNSTPLYSYSGQWNTSPSFDPYVGYLFDNTTAQLAFLKIPVISGASLPQSVVFPLTWRVSVAMKSGVTRENIASFGVSNVIGKSLNLLDFRKPRTIAPTPGVYFLHPEWNDQFVTDIRPEFTDLQEWTLNVAAQKGTETKLSFSGINTVPTQFEAFMIDQSRASSMNLRQDSSYTFTPVFPVSEFTVLVGRADLVKAKLAASMPKEFSLGRNYPNPFNPTTTIPVEIPERSDITLKLYNILGEELKTLYTGVLDPGKYYFDWNGTSYSSGVYFYRLTTSMGKRFVGKMVLMK